MPSTSNVSLKMANLTDLTGRVALISGGGTGIGLMMARGLASNGAKVYISGRRLEIVEKAAAEHQFEGAGQLVPIRMDVGDKKSITEVVKKIEENDGKLHILVNNAGVPGPVYTGKWGNEPNTTLDNEALAAYGRDLFEQTFEQWDATNHTNVAAIFFVTTAFFGLLAKGAESRGGRMSSVINITSAWARTRLNWGCYAYDCSKAAQSHLTKLLATDLSLKRAPIRVNAIRPGTFPSEITGSTEQLTEVFQAKFPGSLVSNPMGRPGKEEEIAGLAVYLASDVSEYVQGEEFGLEGGFFLVNP